jgi:hypothetical protein
VIALGYRDVELAVAQGKNDIFVGPYDLLIIQDTHLSLGLAFRLSAVSKKTVLFTHSECIQGHRDIPYITKLQPDWVFTDQPKGVQVFGDIPIGITWMGHGADGSCHIADVKDIDILWVGHKYDARDSLVQSDVIPLKDKCNMRIHGAGYKHGPLKPSAMFTAMSRARIVVHIGHPVTDDGGYSGTRISDALASCAYVVSTSYYRHADRFPHGVSWCSRVKGDVKSELEYLLDNPNHVKRNAELGMAHVHSYGMATNDMELVLSKING